MFADMVERTDHAAFENGKIVSSAVDMDEAGVNAKTSRTPLRRTGTPQEPANVALFLASDQSRQVTGADYTVNAGSTSFV